MQGLWSLIGKMGTGATPNFPYEIGEKVGNLESKCVWELHQGKKKGSGEPVSVFVVDVKNTSESKVEIAKSGLRRLKSLRHPSVVRFIDGLETDTVIYVVTEPVVPLEIHLAEDENSKSDQAISWGIHQIAASLSFLVNNAGLIHGNICMASVFVDIAGEWKIGGVEYLQPVNQPPNADPAPQLERLPTLQAYDPPEGRKYSKTNRKLEKWSMDMWGLGCLIWELYNGILPRTASLKSVGKIPRNVVTHYVELVGANPKSRPNPAKFIENCRQPGGFMKNEFVDANLFLQELQIKDQKEQKKFFSSLSGSLDKFPEKFCRYKILPQLLSAYEFGSAGSAVLGPLFKVGKLLDTEEYQQKIVPCVVKLFSSTDRATRINLLQQLDNFVQHLKPSTVDEQIFPHVALGFNDTVPAMREHTVKSMLLLVPKLSEKTINNQLLKLFAKLQMDQQPGIRTNTTVCLGKIACHLPEATRQRVLVSAFLRPIRDPFPPARTAGVMAFGATHEYYSLKDCATRILPALCSLTSDPERSVRDQTFKTVKLFLNKLEQASEDPNSIVNQKDSEQVASAGAPSSWTGWAMTSITSKLYRGGNTGASNDQPNPQEQEAKTNESAAKVNQGQKQAFNESHVSKANNENEEGDDSDYDDDSWGRDDGWDDDDGGNAQTTGVVGQLRSDLLAAKKECQTFQESSAVKSAAPGAHGKGGDDSGSDYGDWESDDWSNFTIETTKNVTKSNMNRTVTRKPTGATGQMKLGERKNKAVKENEDALVEELLSTSVPASGTSADQAASGDSWGDMEEDWGGDFDVIGKVKDSKPNTKKSTSSRVSHKASSRTNLPNNSKPAAKANITSSPPSTDFDSWGEDWGSIETSNKQTQGDKRSTADQPQHIQWDKVTPSGAGGGWSGDDWNTDDWLGSSSGSPEAPRSNDLAKKKREERKQQRQQALREKRQASTGRTGAMKLGAVKKD